MTPLQLGTLDSVSANQVNNQSVQNTQPQQTIQQPKDNQDVSNTQNGPQANTNTDNLEKQIQKAIEQLTENLSYLNTHLNISIDKKADSIVIKIIDNKTNQVIKEIPPEYILKIAETINNLVGIIVNKKV